jgi:aquaporin Z/aquaporin NIP
MPTTSAAQLTRNAPPGRRAWDGTRARDDQSTGLHGHPLDTHLATLAVAEAIGTFVLVLTIISTAIGAALAKPIAGVPYGSLAVPLAGGIALAIVVASLGHVSGAHLNPAVTVGLAVNRRFPWAYVPVYIVAQFVGAVLAAFVAWGMLGETARTVAHLGASYPAPGIGAWSAVLAEGVVTFLLTLVVMSVATDNRVPRGTAAIAIGWALSAAIFISGPVSGAGVNPARAIGPMIVAGKFTDWWIYLVAPLVGAILATTLYERFLRRGNAPS